MQNPLTPTNPRLQNQLVHIFVCILNVVASMLEYTGTNLLPLMKAGVPNAAEKLPSK